MSRVTIGMPVFNNARTVERAIASVRAQHIVPWRLVITDDGSEDASLDLARKAAAQDARIVVTRNTHRLGFLNFNVALQAAQTPYFVWLAADDYWHPDFLASTCGALEAVPAAVSALPHAGFIGPDHASVPNLGFLKGSASDRQRAYLAHPGGTRMYGLMRSDAAKAAFPARNMNAYDWYFMIALLRQGPQVSVPQTLLYREQTPWIRYLEQADEINTNPIYRRYPILEMSLHALCHGQLTLRALPALIRLNLRKYDEQKALRAPHSYLRSSALRRSDTAAVARDPVKLEAIAAHLPADTAAQYRAHAVALTPPAPFTAIVTCRNAGATLGAWLDHIAAQSGRVIMIDHGSTDTTRDIATAHGVHNITHVPYEGWFDLTSQLDAKRRIMADLPAGWILHADADEFIDPPDGMSMAALLQAAQADGAITIPMAEHLFLPLFEEEDHSRDSFQDTLKTRSTLHEHDEKQRFFHSSAPLDLWMRTGGHTISRRPMDIASQGATLRHYPGLSLDALRAQYHARVFAPRDTAKLWHGPRKAARDTRIVAPDPALFDTPPRAVPDHGLRHLPVFQRSPARKPPKPHEACDLVLLAGTDLHDAVRRVIDTTCAGLRVEFAEHPIARSRIPVLHIIAHPATLHDKGLRRSQERQQACAWVTQLADARQQALDAALPYVETRLEEFDGTRLLIALRRLMIAPLATGADGFIPADAPPIRHTTFEGPVRAIAAPLAADLGFV